MSYYYQTNSNDGSQLPNRDINSYTRNSNQQVKDASIIYNAPIPPYIGNDMVRTPFVNITQAGVMRTSYDYMVQQPFLGHSSMADRKRGIEDEINDDDVMQNIEKIIGPPPLSTSMNSFIGGLPLFLSNEDIETILGFCGDLKKFKRILDPSGRPKDFGFCEFETTYGLLYAYNILPRLKISKKGKLEVEGTSLKIKLDESTAIYIQNYENTFKDLIKGNHDKVFNIKEERIFDKIKNYCKSTGLELELINQEQTLSNTLSSDAEKGPLKPTASNIVNRNIEVFTDFNRNNLVHEEEGEIDSEYERCVEEEKKRSHRNYLDRLKKWESREISKRHEYSELPNIIDKILYGYQNMDIKKTNNDLLSLYEQFDDNIFYSSIVKDQKVKVFDSGLLEKYRNFSISINKLKDFFIDRQRWRYMRCFTSYKEAISDSKIAGRHKEEHAGKKSDFQDQKKEYTKDSQDGGDQLPPNTVKNCVNNTDNMENDLETSNSEDGSISTPNTTIQRIEHYKVLFVKEWMNIGPSIEDEELAKIEKDRIRMKIISKDLPLDKKTILSYKFNENVLIDKKEKDLGIENLSTCRSGFKYQLYQYIEKKSMDIQLNSLCSGIERKSFIELVYGKLMHAIQDNKINSCQELIEEFCNKHLHNSNADKNKLHEEFTIFILKIVRFVILFYELKLMTS